MPAGLLADITSKIPVLSDSNLLVGFDTSDDGAVYKLSPDIAIIQTLDFFPPMVDDPYIFGQIAAANALSDIAAMGGVPKTAMNIVAFPILEDINTLEKILRGGAEKVAEVGAVLCGGHSINDDSIKYGLSVTGVVHPDKIMQNNNCRIGDAILLTKPLGTGILASGYSAGFISDSAFSTVVKNMCELNQHAFDIASKYDISSITDVTGFGFLGHLNEMVNNNYSICVQSSEIIYFEDALRLAKDKKITGGGKRNKQFFGEKIDAKNISDDILDIMFDPQTSGGLLIAINHLQAKELVKKLSEAGITSSVVAEVIPKAKKNILVV